MVSAQKHGLYKFTLYSLNSANTGILYLDMEKNGVPICRSYSTDSSDGRFHAAGCSALLEMNVGDVVNVICPGGGTAHAYYQTGFVGHLVYLM